MTLPFYTIGHSNRTLAEFFGLLRDADIGALLVAERLRKGYVEE
ncbi:hypothetical protein [Cupriavidus necator]